MSPARESENTSWRSYPIGTCPHGRQFIVVDGKYVRDHFDSDFSQGGNGYAYPDFIPKNELWIDGHLPEEEWEFIAFHECCEADLMSHGMSYGMAHELAKAREDKLRGGLNVTAKPKPKLRGKTKEIAGRFIAEEIETEKYPRKQAIAIGISRARAATKKKSKTKRS